jgi:hypothetical protein
MLIMLDAVMHDYDVEVGWRLTFDHACQSQCDLGEGAKRHIELLAQILDLIHEIPMHALEEACPEG